MPFSINEKPKFRCTFSRNHRHQANVFLSFFFLFPYNCYQKDKRKKPGNLRTMWCPVPPQPPILKCLPLLPSSLPSSIVVLLHPSLLSVYLRRPGFDPMSVQVRFVVDKVALEQVLLWVLHTSPVSVIPPVLQTDSFINMSLSALGLMDKAE